jgi:hypothetical protein
MAARAALIRAIARPRSNSGFALSPVGILDRKAGHAGLHAACDVGRNGFGIDGEAALEIGIDGNVDGRADRRKMRADLLEADAVVGLADRPGKTGAGRGDGLEAKMLKRLRGADVERIGQHEATGLMQLAELSALLRGRYRHDLSPSCFLNGQNTGARLASTVDLTFASVSLRVLEANVKSKTTLESNIC